MHILIKILFISFLVSFQTNGIVYAQQLTVHAGSYPRHESIVEVRLKKKPVQGKSYMVKNMQTGNKAIVETRNNSILFILPDSIKAGDSASYQLLQMTNRVKSPVAVSKKDSGLLVTVHNKPLLFYNTVPYIQPQTINAFYKRSGFIHPLYSPSGSILTDDFPAGHLHQHGIMMAWVNTLFKNKKVDFWNQHLQTGNVKHVNIESVKTSAVTATIKLRLEHYSTSVGAILNEYWTIMVYPFSRYFLFDIQSDQENITGDTLVLNKYHYGGMSFRGSRQWNPDDSLHYKSGWQIQTDSGFNLSNADGKHAAYVTASGLIDGKMASATVMGFASNFRYPQAIRLHPTMPYWCFSPEADGAFTINPGEHYISNYRYLISNEPDLKKTDQVHKDLVSPVIVKVSY